MSIQVLATVSVYLTLEFSRGEPSDHLFTVVLTSCAIKSLSALAAATKSTLSDIAQQVF